ncbi:MAG TPA: hypothetical protein VF151_01530 [Gemmatimonadales bacterium]|jgi:hypothetical protein
MTSVSAPDDVDRAAFQKGLSRGLLSPILWLMGIGSAIAVYHGLKARRMTAASGGQLRDGLTLWWILIVGTLGMLVWLPLLATGLFNQVS